MTKTMKFAAPALLLSAQSPQRGLEFGILIRICFEHWKIRILDLPFDLAQGGESFDSAQDREPVERLVEPFRISCFGFRN
jgi:hypothetical protein